MEKRLIINADDFGLCERVDKGIIDGHTNGILTSTTIMTNMPHAPQAVEMAKKILSLGLGVHLNLTAGKPLCRDAAVKLILDSKGDFVLSPGKLALASLINGKVRTAIETELTLQIQWLLDKGIKPTHLDSHKHIHCFPSIFPIVCRLAKRFGIKAIRYACEPKQVSKLPWPLTDNESRKRASIVRIMSKINRHQNSVFFKTDCLYGINHVGRINNVFFRAVSLYNNSPVAEVMTHPGYIYDLDVTKTRLVNQRQIELEALCSDKTKQAFKEANIKLINYGQL